MSENRNNNHIPTEHKLIPYCNQIIIATLIVIIIAVPLCFDIHIHNVFNLSKITILYVLTFTILATWSIKSIITRRQFRPEHAIEGKDTYESVSRSYAQLLLRQPLNLPIAAYLLVSGLATVFSTYPYLSLVGNYTLYGGFISTVVYISLFFAIINFIDKRRLGLLLNIIILTACIASIYGILQHFGLDFHQWNTTFGHRVSSTFGHPAFFSAFITMVIPLILIKIFFDSHLKSSAFLYLGILTLLIIAFYYTKTRASFLGLIISNLFFFTFIGKKNLLANKTKTVVTITIIIGISVFFNVNNEASVIGRFAGDMNPSVSDNKQSLSFLEDTEIALNLQQDHTGIANQLEGTMRMRVFQYLTGLKIIHDYPILGIGPDTLGIIYPQYLSKVFKEKDEHRYLKNKKTAERIHNDFLDIAVSRGLLGLGVYVWFLFAYARMVWKGCRKTSSSGKLLVIGLCAGCLAYFVQNQFSFGHVSIITPFWFLVAMSVIACHVRYPLSNEDDSLRHLPSHDIRNSVAHEPDGIRWIGSLSSGKFVKRVFCGIVVCLMALLIILSLYRYKADLYFENGRRLIFKREISEAIQSYSMAVKHNPLALNYRNVLNRIYLDMAVIGIGTGRRSIAEGKTRIYSREQISMWITNAIAGAEEVQKLFPGDYHSAFTLGQAYHLLDKTSGKDTSKDAIKYYKKAITLRPFKYEFRNKLAQLYAEKGRYKDAIPELKEAINISPDNQGAYLNLAKVYMNDSERYEEAEAILLEFIEKNPDNVTIEVYRQLNYVYVKSAKWDEVLSQSKKIIQLEQKDLDAHKYAIMASLKLERYDGARNYCNRILKISGSQHNIHSKYAKEILERLSEK
ncbi:MAG: O-antigen ligase family protein [Candidatus Scalindua rubra]|uniref:O-antigen ligase-related domain-containing protein n=1 Tax=Candidatus Scalindua brodae TaxID=237368 RepID=A0A0B0EHU7_9BACT|nr:MAG: hypothetical protein SCABRO_04012 [Candidatus Scalindua brodae]MBZ0109316.1 O-antigen ligase family protein [Candidatus Scalindua rubra]